MTGHCPGRVPPFGYPWIDAYLPLPMAFRSLSRPSSAISALASTLRSYSLDLASIAPPFLRLLRRIRDPLISLAPQLPLPTGSFHGRCFAFSRFFPVQFSRCVLGCPLALRAGRSYAGRTPPVWRGALNLRFKPSAVCSADWQTLGLPPSATASRMLPHPPSQAYSRRCLAGSFEL